MSNIESVVESVDVIIDAYVASWNETDPAKRKSALAASCATDARYRDPVMVSDGQAGLDAMRRIACHVAPASRASPVSGSRDPTHAPRRVTAVRRAR
ncbi:MAG TPA: hypothetical protein VK681_28400, partial [Reyranella sp.]|nr:hypothetical protein [Reyranella sp.]